MDLEEKKGWISLNLKNKEDKPQMAAFMSVLNKNIFTFKNLIIFQHLTLSLCIYNTGSSKLVNLERSRTFANVHMFLNV